MSVASAVLVSRRPVGLAYGVRDSSRWHWPGAVVEVARGRRRQWDGEYGTFMHKITFSSTAGGSNGAGAETSWPPHFNHWPGGSSLTRKKTKPMAYTPMSTATFSFVHAMQHAFAVLCTFRQRVRGQCWLPTQVLALRRCVRLNRNRA